ncbi:fimbria/pilus outer membrane usher protein [Fulvimonas soli]|uniref:Outer membrane usher protein n=1 Tax=Fulvimonas soli TaxID=155197 RepID=A0A316IJK8_9GAMM|nr:fimbria/pilus outer membrane usher protein [Fulvimonas soli]PWK92976.1 outer membrane usher protein [Fulvimonas soli]TNY26545.1 hypothetical protein BV497_07875 [Fulvimonas soli]
MNRQSTPVPRVLWRRPLAALIAGALGAAPLAAPAADAAAAAGPAEASFNSRFLMGGTRRVDLSRFERGNPVLPGVYLVDVYVNGDRAGSGNVQFRDSGAADGAHPCFGLEQLQRYGIDASRLAATATQPEACRSIEQWIPDAAARYDGSQLRLDLSVPQAAMQRSARGYVPPQYWDRGIAAGILGYAFNAFRMRNDAADVAGDGRVRAPDGSTVAPGAAIPVGSTLDGAAVPAGSVFGADGRVIGPDGRPLAPPARGQRVAQDSAYLGLNAGLNVGDWQLRHDSALTWQSGGGRHWQAIATYAQRNLAGIRSQLTVGESSTSGELFDSVSFRGVRLATDDRMLPDSLRGYAPVVRGVAAGNARVEIRQNGYLIYQTTVAPGPFEIDDLYPTGYGGDLQVTVTEADGSQQRFAVPYSSVAQLLRPGIGRYDLTAGQVRDVYLHGHPYLVQGSYQRGLSNLVTGYGGAVFSQGYGALLAGAAFNTRAGAFALDLSHARTRFAGTGGSGGQSLKLGYSKFLTGTGTNFSVAAYRYSTSGYLGLQDALLTRDLARRDLGTEAIRRQRSRFELILNQTLGGAGSLYVTGSLARYWNAPGSDLQYQAGYNSHLGILSYTLSASRTRDALGQRETRYFLSLSLPLGHGAHAPSLNGMFAHSDRGYSTSQLGLSGSAGRDGAFSYGASASDDTRAGSSGAVNAQYRSPYSTLSASYAQGSGYRQASVGANGALVVHAGGVTFSPQQGETMALVEAKGARGARVTNYSGVRVDGEGYALVPYLIPYRYNTVQLDPAGTATDVQLQSTSQQAAPYAGAVVRVVFHTDRGRAALIVARDAAGGPLPFGADVLDGQGREVGVVGQASRLFLRGLADRGSLFVKWGGQPDQQCRIDYVLPPRDGHAYYDSLHATCRPSGDAPATLPSRPVSSP